MNVFVLKIIALSSMIIDHMGAALPQYFGFEFRIIGRLAFPIFVFLIAEGFRHTGSPERFLVRLGVFAILSEPFFDLAVWTDWSRLEQGNILYFAMENINFFYNTNIFYTLYLGGCAIFSYKKLLALPIVNQPRRSNSKKAIKPYFLAPVYCLSIICTMAAAQLLSSDYGAYGVFFIFIMYAIKPFMLRLIVMIPLCLWQHNHIISMLFTGQNVHQSLIMLVLATLIPIPLIAFYNGKRGPNVKWFFYAAYPLHIAIIVGVLFQIHLT